MALLSASDLPMKNLFVNHEISENKPGCIESPTVNRNQDFHSYHSVKILSPDKFHLMFPDLSMLSEVYPAIQKMTVVFPYFCLYRENEVTVD